MAGDLHIHTRESDGSQTINQAIHQAKRIGLEYIAITNHDCITDLSNINVDHTIKLIQGVELSSFDVKRNRRVHILCYLPKNIAPIQAICKETTQNRKEAGFEMAQKVAKLYPISVDELLNIAKESHCIYKQHIAKALMNAGYTTKIFGELYDELFDFKTGSCIINCKQPNVYEVLEAVKSSGGITVMAHPFTYDSIDLLKEFVAQNLLDGIEVWSSKSTYEQEQFLLQIAQENGLITTGGSDFHGAYASRISPIGAKTTPKHSINALLGK